MAAARSRFIAAPKLRFVPVFLYVRKKIPKVCTPFRDPGERKKLPDPFSHLAGHDARERPDEFLVIVGMGDFDREVSMIAADRELMQADAETPCVIADPLFDPGSVREQNIARAQN